MIKSKNWRMVCISFTYQVFEEQLIHFAQVLELVSSMRHSLCLNEHYLDTDKRGIPTNKCTHLVLLL